MTELTTWVSFCVNACDLQKFLRCVVSCEKPCAFCQNKEIRLILENSSYVFVDLQVLFVQVAMYSLWKTFYTCNKLLSLLHTFLVNIVRSFVREPNCNKGHRNNHWYERFDVTVTKTGFHVETY